MKPKKLVVCGWGPYKDKQEIDFEQLNERGLFLVSGPTGAGKTSLFDAITYALYGNMSGMVREKNSVRSDFAGEDILTYVELWMTHDGKDYHIYRNPEYLRPKKRKTGNSDMTKEKERAVLTLEDGSKVEGVGEVTSKIQEILRLDYRQFKQLSLIAQGEFAKLMTASSSEKSKILREIFDTELYDRIAMLLRSRSASLYNRIKEYRHKMEEDVTFFAPMPEDESGWRELTEGSGFYYEEILRFLQRIQNKQEEILVKCESDSVEISREADALTKQMAEAQRMNQQFDKQEQELQKKQELDKKALLMEECEKKLLRARQALIIRPFEQDFMYAVEKGNELSKEIDGLEEEVISIRNRDKEAERFKNRWNQIELVYEQKQKATELADEQKRLEKNKEEQEKVLKALQEEYLFAEQQELLAKADYEEAERNYRYAMAGILASGLQDEMPCPVCGSLHHPDKAHLPENIPTQEQVKEKKCIFESKQQMTLSIHGKAAAGKERAEGISESIKQCIGEKERLLREVDIQDEFVKEYTESYTQPEYLQARKNVEALAIQLNEKEELLKKEKEAYIKQKELIKEANANYIYKYREGGFETEERYKEAFLSEEEIEKLSNQTGAYREEKHANEQMLLHLNDELRDKKPAHIPMLQKKLDEVKIRREEAEKALGEKRHYVQDIVRLKEALQQKNKEKNVLEDEYGIIKRLDDAASGNNPLHLVFEQYVLAAYFEEILKAANIRLRVMSSGRYELCRIRAIGDGRKKDNLEIEVLDYYTGKYRSVKTLSGGETFKTSLALALGMSDVVQAYSGGIRVETLFVDEGFGSLDSESLEQACITLQSLVERDHLIGIISHVPELSEKITGKIRIHKTNTGSRVEIVVS